MAGPVRQHIDTARLERFVKHAVPGVDLPLAITQFTFGQSNPTYLLEDARGAKLVLRKKPPGQLLSKSAHRVEREYRILQALQQTDVPVPRTICLCQDDAVIGTPFYIMEYLDGRTFEDPALPGVSPDERREMWHDALATLAKFHLVQPADVGLQDYGKSSVYYARQLATLHAVHEAQASVTDIETMAPVGPVPHYGKMASFFGNRRTQPLERAGLVHGDYKIDNLVFHKTEPRVIGILDWEMSTIGHPLSDLANLLMPFKTATSTLALELGHGSKEFQQGAILGLPSLTQNLAWYSDITAWDPSSDMTWGAGFALFKLSLITQGIAARHAKRQASSAKAVKYGNQRFALAEVAWSFVTELQANERSNL